jgi:hypothetical protein
MNERIVYVQAPRAKGFPHFLHFLMTVLTLGAWLPIWVLHRCLSSR